MTACNVSANFAVLLADLAPSFPEVPFIGGDVPDPSRVIMAGLALSLALAGIGLFATRKAGIAVRAATALIVLAVILGGSVAFAYWSKEQRLDYQHQVENRVWTPPPHFQDGPSEETPVLEPPRPDSPVAEPADAKSPAPDPL